MSAGTQFVFTGEVNWEQVVRDGFISATVAGLFYGAANFRVERGINNLGGKYTSLYDKSTGSGLAYSKTAGNAHIGIRYGNRSLYFTNAKGTLVPMRSPNYQQTASGNVLLTPNLGSQGNTTPPHVLLSLPNGLAPAVLPNELVPSTGGGSGSKINPLDDPKIAKDIIADSDAVYGYKPKPGSSLERFDIDWSNADEVAKARAMRLEYLEAMESKKIKLNVEVDNYLAEGKSMSGIAEIKVNQRNIDRMNSYVEKGDYKSLEKLYERNLLEYGNKEGPTVQQLYKKYGSYEDVIYASVKINKGMNVLLGIEN